MLKVCPLRMLAYESKGGISVKDMVDRAVPEPEQALKMVARRVGCLQEHCAWYVGEQGICALVALVSEAGRRFTDESGERYE